MRARDVYLIAPRYDLLNHVLSMNVDRPVVESYRARVH